MLDGLPWTEVPGRAVLAIPLGSTEQHGPHLPLGTDTAIAAELAGRLAAARPDVLVAPALAYGASGEHAGFPGTLSIGTEALRAVLVELGRSADAFSGVLFLSAHGGNAAAVRSAVDLLVAEGRPVRAWSPPPGADAHAGYTETAVMLALRPALVRAAAACPGERRPLRELMPMLAVSGVKAVSPSGVLGDPAGASAEAGAALLAAWAQALLDDLSGWP